MARGWHYTKLSLSSDCSMSHHRVARGQKQRIDLSDHNLLLYPVYVRMYGHTYSKSMDQPGKVASPACRQLNKKNEYFPVCVRA